MLNKAILQGRLCADPELKYTQSNIPVLQARVACDRDYKKDGQQNADFINIVAWRQTAEFISKYFGKGNMILLEGRIQVRDYTDRDGNKRYVTEVVVEHVNFCGSKRDNAPRNTAPQNTANYGGYDAPQQNNAGYGGYNAEQQSLDVPMDDDDGELPF